jgi:hypothetical protein
MIEDGRTIYAFKHSTDAEELNLFSQKRKANNNNNKIIIFPCLHN